LIGELSDTALKKLEHERGIDRNGHGVHH